MPVCDTKSFPDDLTQFLVDSFTGLEDFGMRRALPQLFSAAQADEHVAEVLAQFTAQRRAALRALLAHLLAAGAADAMQPSRPGKGG